MKKGVVLLNMGGPNNIDEVEVFLSNMFHDENIITTKSTVLRSLIATMIVQSRKKKSKSIYQKIGGKSPLVEITQMLVDKLNTQEELYFAFAMRYTKPYAKSAIAELKKQGITHLLILPLYPQYSTTTTKSSVEDFIMGCYAEAFTPDIKILNRFYAESDFNLIIARQIQATLQADNASDFHLIFSAHSLPKKIVENGDTYEQEVYTHVKLIKAKLSDLGLEFASVGVAFQSKLGPLKWLEPSLEETMRMMGGKKVMIYPISFVIDNSETIVELGMDFRALAHEVGVGEYRVCDAPNDSDSFVRFIQTISMTN